MSLIAETAPQAPARTASTMRTGHPSLGRAPEAVLIPISLTCYQVALADQVKGYICVKGREWECFAGAHMADARSIGTRASLTVAIRDLVTDIPHRLTAV
ncbi:MULTISPECIES: hypothetical protein [Microbacterium]|uniref:hypothetical protein n=1 Tax=Microbacterium TaxID=33882 RepID=UPI0024AF4D61|nr:hypothetical protein [Microbacterium barkeri]MDI6942277.1 hypothetical protein [Microbacterium barkeri]